MGKNTSISLDPHFDGFIAQQLQNGRYASTSEVIRAGLRLLEESETRLDALRNMLIEGETSGVSDYSLASVLNELDADHT